MTILQQQWKVFPYTICEADVVCVNILDLTVSERYSRTVTAGAEAVTHTSTCPQYTTSHTHQYLPTVHNQSHTPVLAHSTQPVTHTSTCPQYTTSHTHQYLPTVHNQSHTPVPAHSIKAVT